MAGDFRSVDVGILRVLYSSDVVAGGGATIVASFGLDSMICLGFERCRVGVGVNRAEDFIGIASVFGTVLNLFFKVVNLLFELGDLFEKSWNLTVGIYSFELFAHPGNLVILESNSV